MIDHVAIRAELDEILQSEMRKSFWSKAGKTPVEKEVHRKDGTSFMETFYTAVKKIFKPSGKTPEPLYPGSFATEEEAEKVLGKPHEPGALSDWYDQISSRHKQAIKQYSGFWYSKINGLKRGTMLKTDMDSQDYAETRHCSKLIEEALEKYELKQDIVVHRQVSKDMLPQFQNSKLFMDSGFFSTTVVKDSVNRHNSIDLVVKVPKGKGRGAYIKYLSDHPFEKEFLINSHSVFNIDSVKKIDGRYRVELTWVSRMEVI